MAGAKIKVDTPSELAAVVQRMNLKLRPYWTDLGEYLLRSHEARFRREEDPQGNQWAVLSERTKAEKARKRKHPKRLHRDLNLKRLHYQVSGDQLELGTSLVYGAIHQFGGRAGRGKKVVIPARPFLGLSAADEAEAIALLQEHIEAALAG